MKARKIALGAAGLATVAAAVTGGVGASMAYADASESSSGSSASSSATAESDKAESGKGRGQHTHTEVTGDEATKVTDAVKAQDADFVAEKVLKDEDGSYDVIGTSGEDDVKYDVSSDLATVTKSERGPGGGRHGGGPGFDHEEVTGDDATKVSEAVTAKDSAVTVEKVFKNDDGSYVVAGTKDSERIMFKVSSDLGTVEELERPEKGERPDGERPEGGHGPDDSSDSDDSSEDESSESAESSGSSDPTTSS